MKKLISLFFVLLIFISACSSQPGAPRIQPLESTPAPALDASPTLAQESSRTGPAPEKPGNVPALSEQQAIEQITELFNTNAGCKLPCFWGITPGQTTVAEARGVLDPFSAVDLAGKSGQGDVLEYYFDIGNPDLPGVHLQLFPKEDVVEAMSVSSFESPAYHLASFLEQNGKPDQVLVRTWKSSPAENGQVPFLLYMYYEKTGMLAAYGMGNGTVGDDTIHGCVEKSPSFLIWGSEKPESVENAMLLAGWYDQNLHFLADAAGGALDVDKFYETFSGSAAETCFDTPRDLWAEPER